jgi:uncharacterized protein YerC
MHIVPYKHIRRILVLRTVSLFLLLTMTRGRVVSEDLRRSIVEMAQDMPYEEIHDYTGVSIRSIRRFVKAANDGVLLAAQERVVASSRVLHDDSIRVSTLRCPHER